MYYKRRALTHPNYVSKTILGVHVNFAKITCTIRSNDTWLYRNFARTKAALTRDSRDVLTRPVGGGVGRCVPRPKIFAPTAAAEVLVRIRSSLSHCALRIDVTKMLCRYRRDVCTPRSVGKHDPSARPCADHGMRSRSATCRFRDK